MCSDVYGLACAFGEPVVFSDKILTSSTWTECEGSPRLVCLAETSELVELHHLHDQGIPHVTSGISLSLYNK